MLTIKEGFKNTFRDILDILTIENPGPYITGEELLKTIQTGDLIQFRRSGYVHWGMYCGKESIIHLRNTGQKKPRNLIGIETFEEYDGQIDRNSAEKTSLNDNKQEKEVFVAVVEMAKLIAVANGDLCRVNNREKMAEKWAKREPENFEQRSAEVAVKEARMMLLVEIEYDLKNKNCEHVCTKWKYNISHSDQVNQAYNVAKAATVTVAIGSAATAGGVAVDFAKGEADKKAEDVKAEADRKAEEAKEKAAQEMNNFKPSFLK
jgi:hypothetical protein